MCRFGCVGFVCRFRHVGTVCSFRLLVVGVLVQSVGLSVSFPCVFVGLLCLDLFPLLLFDFSLLLFCFGFTLLWLCVRDRLGGLEACITRGSCPGSLQSILDGWIVRIPRGAPLDGLKGVCNGNKVASAVYSS